MRRATGRSQAPRRPPDVETQPDRRPTRQIPWSARFPPSKRTVNQRAPQEDVRRLRTTELVPRSVSLLGISSHGTGRAHQWLGAGPVAAVWPACLSLPSIVRMMAHNAPLSSANSMDSGLRGSLLVPAVTDPSVRNQAILEIPLSTVAWRTGCSTISPMVARGAAPRGRTDRPSLAPWWGTDGSCRQGRRAACAS